MTAGDSTDGGQPIHRHDETTDDTEVTPRDPALAAAREAHLRTHLGEWDSVIGEEFSELIQLDLHLYRPTDERPWITLVTSGMSDRPMTNEQGVEVRRELLMGLPREWPAFTDGPRPVREGEHEWSLLEDEVNWPIGLLKYFALVHAEADSFLRWGYIVVNNYEEPYAYVTSFVAAMIGPPVGYDPQLMKAETPRGEVEYLAVYPLTDPELEFMYANCAKDEYNAELLAALGDAGVTAVLDPARASVIDESGSVRRRRSRLGRLFGRG